MPLKPAHQPVVAFKKAEAPLCVVPVGSKSVQVVPLSELTEVPTGADCEVATIVVVPGT